jgi:hypothetical protein
MNSLLPVEMVSVMDGIEGFDGVYNYIINSGN